MPWPQKGTRARPHQRSVVLQNLVPVSPFLLRHWYSTCLSAKDLPMEVYRYPSGVCLPTCCATNIAPTAAANKGMPINPHISFNPSKYSSKVCLKAVSHTNVKGGKHTPLHLYRYSPGCEGAGAPPPPPPSFPLSSCVFKP